MIDQLHLLTFVISLLIPMFAGITLLIVWRFEPTQRFVLDFALSNLATVIFFAAYLSLFQSELSWSAPGFWLAVIAATLNLTFLLTSMNHLAGFNLARRDIVLLALITLTIFALPPGPEVMWWKIWFAMLSQVALGLISTVWLRKKNSSERYLGPLIALLGLSQLFVIFGGLESAYLQIMEASLVRFIIGFLLLFSALRRSKRELQKSFERFRMMTERSPQGVLVLDLREVLYSNRAARKIYKAVENPLALTSDLIIRDEFLIHYQQLQHGQLELANWSEKKTRTDGKVLSLSFSAWRIEWDERSAVQVLITDETDLIDSAVALLHQETHDALTGLPNRRMLVQELNKNCASDELRSYCMLTILNINRFKLFNQGKGHLIGDRVLREFSNKLRRTVGPETAVMRLGGDEFGLVSTNARTVAGLNQRLKEICDEPMLIEDGEFSISVAMGQAEYPVNAFNADGLLRAANAAMHQAKKIPGTSLVQADTRFEESLSRALEQEQALKSAIINHEICLYYQPQVDARTRKLVGFEALARWIKPGVGIVNPIEFIAVAEQTALISALGEMLLNDACGQIAAWQGQYAQCVPVAVNVSPIQLLNENFVGLIQALLLHYQIPAYLLNLEITESAAINDLEQTKNQIDELLALGIQVAMDDFGTGYSSLSMLRQLPLQTLKIDRALIDPLPSADAMAIVTSICQLAEALNMQVVAEGIETEAHAQAAAQVGCHELQGYLFSRPVTAMEAGLWLDRLNAFAPARD